jgi:chromosome segregation ATPase
VGAIAAARGEGAANAEQLRAARAAIVDKERSIEELAGHVKRLSEDNTGQSSRIGELEKMVENQNETIDARVDSEEYQALRNRYAQAKQAVREARLALRERAGQIETLENERTSAESMASECSGRTEKAESALDEAVRKLAGERTENERLRRQLHARNRELLASERTMREFAEQMKVRQSHLQSMAAEAQAQKERTHIHREKKTRPLSDQLREMAQNLSGTLC